MLSESEQAKKAGSEIVYHKDTVFHLNSEKGTTLLQYYQCTERLSTLESEALSSLTDEMASEVQKMSSVESRNTMIQ
jgi:hypothetical protein